MGWLDFYLHLDLVTHQLPHLSEAVLERQNADPALSTMPGINDSPSTQW